MLSLLLLVGIANGFLLSPDEITYPGIYTHDKITKEGVSKAVSNFIIKHKLVDNPDGTANEIIRRYFGTDLDGFKRFQGVIDGFIQVFGRDKRDPRSHIHVYCEQIQLAHEHISQMKNDIKHHISQRRLTPDLIDVIREKVAHALYTLQNFYSNTNWIEMKGAEVYEDFGRPGWQLMKVAPSSMDTCRNCKGSCDDTLLVSDYLTSGYMSGVDIFKPFRESDATEGKCSHGGIFDNSSLMVAQGGINKETNDPRLSPHFVLHYSAAQAAIKATEAFFVSNETGILNILGKENFQSLLAIHSAANAVHTSLAFNIDTTASMTEEIQAVIDITVDMVMTVMDSANRPADYVLATFNDPASLTTGYVTLEGFDMIKQLKKLRVSSITNFDCPEYAMHGLKKAVELSRNNSQIYTFTDAEPKDRDMADQVLLMAKEKNLRLVFIISGTCETSRSAHTHQRVKKVRYKSAQQRSVVSESFQSLANETGGVLHSVSKEGLTSGTATEKIKADIETDFPSSSVQLDARVLPVVADSRVPIFVDDDLNVIKFLIENSRTVTASLYRPNGTDVIQYNSNSTLVVTSDKTLIVSVQSPVPGRWILERKQNTKWTINITGQSVVDFDVKLFTVDGVKLSSQPISGDNYTVVLSFYNLHKNTTLSTVFLTADNGSVLQSSTLTPSVNDTPPVFSAVITMPDMLCRLHINGTDPAGHIFRRMMTGAFKPVNVMLSLEPIFGDVFIDVPHNASFRISNFGNENETYTVKITDNQNAIRGKKSMDIFLEAKQTKEGGFAFQGHSVNSLLRYTITVNLQGSTEILQSLSNTVLFTTKQHPECSVVVKHGSCSVKSLNTRDCVRYNWTASGMVTYKHVNLQSIFISNEASVFDFIYDNFTLQRSPVTVNVSGSCCNPFVYVNIVDEDGYTARCDFKFGDPREIKIVQHPVCRVASPDKCLNESLNTKNCSLYKWKAAGEVTFAEVELLPLALPTDITSIDITHSNISRSPVFINASSTCCNPSVHVNTTDSDGHIGNCHFYFADPDSIQTVLEHPVCFVRNISGNCPTQSLNTRDCSKYVWSASGEIIYFGVTLSSITVNKNIVSSFTYDNFNASYNPVKVNASGTCCNPSVFVDIEDNQGYTTSCNFTFANASDIKDIKQLKLQAHNGLSKAGIIGIVVAVVVVVLVSVIVITVCVKKKKTPEYKLSRAI